MYEGSPSFWALILLAIFLAGYIKVMACLFVWLQDDEDYGDWK